MNNIPRHPMICPKCYAAPMREHPNIPRGWIKCELCGYCEKEKKK